MAYGTIGGVQTLRDEDIVMQENPVYSTATTAMTRNV